MKKGIPTMLFGMMGTILMCFFISRDRGYTYSSPFTSHEKMMIFLLVFFIIMSVVGICVIVFSVIRKRNEDMLYRVENMQGNGKILGVCPKCGLNLADNAKTCPKCGTKINL